MWPPYAVTTAWHLFLIEKISFLHTSRGIASHSSKRASCSCWSDVGRLGRFLILRSSSSQRCSIGFRSGDFEGHGITGIPMLARWAVVRRAACGLALSCMNTRFGLRTNSGTTVGLMTCSRYCSAFNVPSTMIKSDFSCRSIAPPYHHTSSPVLVLLPDAVVTEPLTNSPISCLKAKSWLVTEDDCAPLYSRPPRIGTCPC